MNREMGQGSQSLTPPFLLKPYGFCGRKAHERSSFINIFRACRTSYDVLGKALLTCLACVSDACVKDQKKKKKKKLTKQTNKQTNNNNINNKQTKPRRQTSKTQRGYTFKDVVLFSLFYGRREK